MNINLVESLFCYTFAPDKSHLDRLVAHCRLFIECNLEQNVELRTVSKSTQFFPIFPRLAFIIGWNCVNLPKSLVCYNLCY